MPSPTLLHNIIVMHQFLLLELKAPPLPPHVPPLRSSHFVKIRIFICHLQQLNQKSPPLSNVCQTVPSNSLSTYPPRPPRPRTTRLSPKWPKKVAIPGFRKGAKIPTQVLENAWAKQGGKKALKTMTINDLCGELIGATLKLEYELEPIGQPTLVTPAEQLAESFTPGEDLEVVVKCDVWPEI